MEQIWFFSYLYWENDVHEDIIGLFASKDDAIDYAATWLDKAELFGGVEVIEEYVPISNLLDFTWAPRMRFLKRPERKSTAVIYPRKLKGHFPIVSEDQDAFFNMEDE